MRKPATTFDALLGEIYAAATEPILWPQVVRELAHRHGAHVGALFTPYEGAHERYLFATSGMDPALGRSYGEYWHQHDAWKLAGLARRQLRSLTVHLGESIVPERDLVRTAFYNEYLRDMETRHLVASTLFDDSDAPMAPLTVLSLLRAPKAGAFGSSDREQLQALLPHLRRALGVYWSQRRARESLVAREAALDAQGVAIFWLSPRGQIEYANAAARALQASGRLLRSAGNRVTTFAVPASQPLGEALAAACAGRPATVALAGTPAHVAHVLPPRPVQVAGRAIFGVLLQIERAPGTVEAGAIGALTRLHHLTAAEAQVLQRLADGATPAEIATALCVSTATVRSHLKALFGKTGVRRQADLVRLAHAHGRRSVAEAMEPGTAKA